MNVAVIVNETDELQEPPPTEKFLKLFSGLEDCEEKIQIQKIVEMIELMEEMNKGEFVSVLTKQLFNEMDKIIEEEKLSMEIAILLLKHAGYCSDIKNEWIFSFRRSSLSKRFQNMIDEEEKKKEKNVKLLVDLCECYLTLYYGFSSEFVSIYATYLLKAALKKEENEEIKKEVEMALLSLSNIPGYYEMEQELFLDEIKEIIQYHQEHRNLTRLAYHSAWRFLIGRLFADKSLKDVIVNEMHFIGEARRELDELSKYVDWKRKEEEKERRKRREEENIFMRWIETLTAFFCGCTLRNEEYVGLVSSIVSAFRTARDNYGEISRKCIYLFEEAAYNRAINIDDLLKEGALDIVLEEIQQPTLDEEMLYECFIFFMKVFWRLKEKTDDEKEEEERKATKMEMFERMEEEGYEEVIESFHKIMDFLNSKYNDDLSLSISDYFVNI
ncbi:uncharacterized protein MONOS_18115 [Monocercomonoides exilis]|uniref:uncharacterized protein n=1 Tax=Monocercomonoides exilis TaxID=2049356 RepID=UPI00355AA305|nr:hypothetical protein MONOS_18115 [Monocercomonoides exilis]